MRHLTGIIRISTTSKINWEEEKERCEAGIINVNTDSELIDLLLEIVEPLRDAHVWFSSKDEFIRSYRSDKFRNWDRTVWEEYVLSNNWKPQEYELGYCYFRWNTILFFRGMEQRSGKNLMILMQH